MALPPNRFGPIGSLLRSATSLTPGGIAGSIGRRVGGTIVEEIGRQLAPGVLPAGRELLNDVTGQPSNPNMPSAQAARRAGQNPAAKPLRVSISSGNIATYMSSYIASIMQNYHLPDLKTPQKSRECISHLDAALPIGKWSIVVTGQSARLTCRSHDNHNVLNFVIN